MRQSSPTMKSHQKRAKPFAKRTTRPPARPRGASSLTVAQASAHQAASSTSRASVAAGPAQARVVGREPAQALDGPEGAEGAEQQPDDELDRVLGHARERLVQRHAGGEDDHAADRRAERREGDRVGVEPEGDDDEDDLEALEEDPLEADHEGEPVEPEAALVAGGPRGLDLRAERVLLVVQGLQAGGAQDRLAQPLQPEDQQQRADDELQQGLGQPGPAARNRPAR